MGGDAIPVCLDVNKVAPPDTSVSLPETLLPTGKVFWCYCNVREAIGARVTARLTLADGSRQTLRTQVEDDEYDAWDKCAKFEYQFPDIPEPGLMTFTARLSGRAITDVTNATVGEVVFEGWRSDEPIRLISYVSENLDDNKMVYAGELRTQADADGVLRVQTAPVGEPVPFMTLFAAGRDSNCQMFDPSAFSMDQPVSAECETFDPDVVSVDGTSAIVTWTYEGPPRYAWQPCEDAPESQFIAGQTAVVNVTSLSARAEPSPNADIAGRLRRNEPVTLEDGPECGDGAVWWSVSSTRSDVTGWVKERDGRQVWLAREP